MTQKTGLIGLLRVRKVRLPLVAQTVSVFGDTALFITLAIWAKELTGSSSAAGVVILALSTGSMTGPVTARWIDAHPPRRWLIAANLAGAAVTPALLLVHSAAGVWIIYGVAFLYGLIGTVVSAALTAYLKETVPPELAVPVNVEFRALTELMRSAVPAAGAGLYARTGLKAVVLMTSPRVLAAVLAAEDDGFPRGAQAVGGLHGAFGPQAGGGTLQPFDPGGRGLVPLAVSWRCRRGGGSVAGLPEHPCAPRSHCWCRVRPGGRSCWHTGHRACFLVALPCCFRRMTAGPGSGDARVAWTSWTPRTAAAAEDSWYCAGVCPRDPVDAAAADQGDLASGYFEVRAVGLELGSEGCCLDGAQGHAVALAVSGTDTPARLRE